MRRKLDLRCQTLYRHIISSLSFCVKRELHVGIVHYKSSKVPMQRCSFSHALQIIPIA